MERALEEKHASERATFELNYKPIESPVEDLVPQIEQVDLEEPKAEPEAKPKKKNKHKQRLVFKLMIGKKSGNDGRGIPKSRRRSQIYA